MLWGVVYARLAGIHHLENWLIFVHLAVISSQANSSATIKRMETWLGALKSCGPAVYTKRVSFCVFLLAKKVVARLSKKLFILTTRTVIRCHANSSELRATSDLGLAFLQSLKPRLYTKTTVFDHISHNFSFSRDISTDFHEIQRFGAFPNIFGIFLEQKVVTTTILLNCRGCRSYYAN